MVFDICIYNNSNCAIFLDSTTGDLLHDFLALVVEIYHSRYFATFSDPSIYEVTFYEIVESFWPVEPRVVSLAQLQ